MKRADTLWSQHAPADRRMMELTAGDDRAIDRVLLVWDVLGSLGHVEGLRASRLLTAGEHATLRRGLRSALAAAARGRLAIGDEHEDAHTAVETWLTARIGRAGGKLPTGRSRNDQIACDLRLWLKRALLDAHTQALDLVEELLRFAGRHRRILVPGLTHTRRAMPSSVGLWAAGHAAGLLDTVETLPALWATVDRSPLGSAAGYGAPLPLDRAAAARALGFRAVESPVTAVQNGRGRLEAAALFWCAQLGHDAAKVASDAILFSGDGYGWLVLDPSHATGSSLMPHKRNPDLFELARARAASVDADLAAVLAIRAKLPSGYHRDFQMIKEPLLRGVLRTTGMLEMVRIGIGGLGVDRVCAAAGLDDGVLATDAALELTIRGVPFREAYRRVAEAVAGGRAIPRTSRSRIVASRDSMGGLARLPLDEFRRRLAARRRAGAREERRFHRALVGLAGPGALPAPCEPEVGRRAL